jgi:hypothetical protein
MSLIKLLCFLLRNHYLFLNSLTLSKWLPQMLNSRAMLAIWSRTQKKMILRMHFLSLVTLYILMFGFLFTFPSLVLNFFFIYNMFIFDSQVICERDYEYFDYENGYEYDLPVSVTTRKESSSS